MPNTEPVRVSIYNQSYSLLASGAEDAASLEELAQSVDELMRSIARRAGNLDATRTAVLTCLHLADQLRNLRRDLETLKTNVDAKAREFTLLLDGVIEHPNSTPPER